MSPHTARDLEILAIRAALHAGNGDRLARVVAAISKSYSAGTEAARVVVALLLMRPFTQVLGPLRAVREFPA
jgi:hypothetical protein